MTIHVKAKQIQWVSVAEKAVATAIQSGLAVVVVADVASAKAALVAAVAAGLAVLKNAVKDWVSALEKS
jgi:hypothetical protein|tara:strand:- start:3624 stop:3830 length:207 start_codon:yes stop_codon:yes gene_type:complete